MQSTAHDFKHNVDEALANPNLQDSLGKLKVGFSERRRQAVERLPEFEALRDRARDIKDHTLENLDFYLEEFERKVLALGSHVHWDRKLDSLLAETGSLPWRSHLHPAPRSTSDSACLPDRPPAVPPNQDQTA